MIPNNGQPLQGGYGGVPGVALTLRPHYLSRQARLIVTFEDRPVQLGPTGHSHRHRAEGGNIVSDLALPDQGPDRVKDLVQQRLHAGFRKSRPMGSRGHWG